MHNEQSLRSGSLLTVAARIVKRTAASDGFLDEHWAKRLFGFSRRPSEGAPQAPTIIKAQQHTVSYRPDIDGLRAVAVLAVVAFHAFPGIIPGGFVGVDVFFVISGYLITSILISDLKADSFSVARFYSRRIRRIFPALILVMVACLFVGWFVLFAGEYAQLGKHVAGGAGFISNFILLNEVGYFDTAASTKPLLHLWSLGVEEQFYLIWPMLLWIGWRLNINLFILVVLLSFVSFGLAVSTSADQLATSFYSPQDRLWELSVGAALAYFAVAAQRRNEGTPIVANRYLAGILSTFGIVLLMIALFLVRQSSFPGWQTLLPTTGTFLMILAGPNAFWNRQFLSVKILVSTGLISYPLYLWHWPLLSFSRILGLDDKPAVIAGAVILAVVLSCMTYWLLEKPARFSSSKRIVTGASVASMIAVGLAGYMTASDGGLPSRKIAILGDFDAVRGEATIVDYMDKHFYPCEPSFIAADSKRRKTRDGDAVRCRQSRPGGSYDIALIGDSHAEHLFIGLARALPEKNILYYEKGFLPFRYNKEFFDIYNFIANDSRIRTVIVGLLASKADKDWYEQYANLPAGSTIAEEMESSVSFLQHSGKEVLIPDDVPLFDFSPSRCLQRWFDELKLREDACRESVSRIDRKKSTFTAALQKVAAIDRDVRILKIERYFCAAEQCSMIRNHKLLFFDSNHLNIDGSDYVATKLLKDYPAYW